MCINIEACRLRGVGFVRGRVRLTTDLVQPLSLVARDKGMICYKRHLFILGMHREGTLDRDGAVGWRGSVGYDACSTDFWTFYFRWRYFPRFPVKTLLSVIVINFDKGIMALCHLDKKYTTLIHHSLFSQSPKPKPFSFPHRLSCDSNRHHPIHRLRRPHTQLAPNTRCRQTLSSKGDGGQESLLAGRRRANKNNGRRKHHDPLLTAVLYTGECGRIRGAEYNYISTTLQLLQTRYLWVYRLYPCDISGQQTKAKGSLARSTARVSLQIAQSLAPLMASD